MSCWSGSETKIRGQRIVNMGVKILTQHSGVPGIDTFEVYRKQGGYAAVEKALKSMNYPVESVRIGKFMEVALAEEDKAKAEEIIHEICRKLLSNPVIEDYSFELEG